MMGTPLQQLLQNLCLNTEWNYAVFWKLKNRTRMVLTWEDAYYHNHARHESCSSKCNEGLQSLHEGHFSHDPLGLAVAKMSYHIYSLGEGIVGQVAVTGKHQWILADEHAVNSLLSSERCDGWQAQFFAGIQTVVVASVLPHGVVQLGSLNKVTEDIKLVAHLRDAFSTFQDSSTSAVSSPMLQSLQKLMIMPDLPMDLEILHGCPVDLHKGITGENLCLPLQNQGENVYGATFPGHITEAVGLVANNKSVTSMSRGGDSANGIISSHQKQESKEYGYDNSCEKSSSYGAVLSANKYVAGCISSSSDLLKPSTHDRFVSSCSGLPSKAVLNTQLHSEQQLQSAVGKNTAFEPDSNYLDMSASSYKLSSGYELHEALGHGFLQNNCPWWLDVENPELLRGPELADGLEHSMLTSETGSDHLLEAVVADFCNKESNFSSMKSLTASADSLLTTEKIMPEPSCNTSGTVGSACYSIDCSSLLKESSQQHHMTSSGSYSIKSSKAFSSPGPSMCRDQFLRPNELLKANKKRAKPGESSRPRPRDRQLIQDRIKELRELVPNGSKCSIDSLLERTIKHMLFLQSITKHADKLSNCARARANNKDSGNLGSCSYDQGASWAVEVGGHMKICPIVVENLNMNGQMLIEMLCENCDHFLEIAEAIRGLGLTILNGGTDGRGDRTWMRFVVEGQNNRNMHRMDVLWSLVQLLQTKTTTTT